MASNNSGANFFIQQVRTVAEFNLDLSAVHKSNRRYIQSISHAPYKGSKQTKSSSKVLKALASQLQGDLSKIQKAFDNSTSWIDNAMRDPDWQRFDKDRTEKFESCYRLNSKAPKAESSGLGLHNFTKKTNSSLTSASLASEKGAQTNGSPSHKLKIRVPQPNSPTHILKIKVPRPNSATTEYNGVTKNVTRSPLRLILNLSPKDRAKLKSTSTTTRNNEVAKNVTQRKPLLTLNLSPEDRAKLKLTSTTTGSNSATKNVTRIPPRIKLNLSAEDRAKLKSMPITTGNNGVAKNPTGSPLRIKFKFDPEDQAKLSQREQSIQSIEEDLLDDMDIDNESSTSSESQTPTERLITSLKANGDRYNSTRYYKVSIRAKMTAEEKGQAELNICVERFFEIFHRLHKPNNPWRTLDDDWYKALKKESKNPTMVSSQVQAKVGYLATRTPRPWSSYRKSLSKQGVKATQAAQQVIDLKSKIANLVRATEEYNQVATQGGRIRQTHTLSTLPLHMHMAKKDGGLMTVAGGRIERGTEAKWTSNKRNFVEMLPSTSDVDIKQESRSNKRLRFCHH